MSDDRDIKVQQIAHKLQDCGKPMLYFLRVITWEQPLSWAIIFAACSTLYVILHNLSIRTFSILGFFLVLLDYYFNLNNVKIPDMTEAEKEHLHRLCSKLVTVQTNVKAAISQFRTANEEDRINVYRQLCLYLGFGILVSLCVDNLLLFYLTASSVLLLIGMSSPQSDNCSM